ncbi:MAG: tRNA (adenosine(37)-N6)-threonylcarbamoyltransferase complex ATPase subunit type 1 TsaE [Candidatus Ryanbacteria bacterium]|nr:tRNA (adenosine(37)-N6)-threonylcarbamoyltransferase complex ATPase subunit type 1 TsaE [Candidatus Ryanbacteria bacterium]
MELTYALKTPEATRALGKLFGAQIKTVARNKKYALCLALSGELGAGKTFFTQSVANGLGVRGRLQSPTFVIAKRYALKGSTFKNVWHFDLYRIKSPRELDAIAFKKIILDPKNIVVVEWAERAKKIFPKDTVWISFRHIARAERMVRFRHGA